MADKWTKHDGGFYSAKLLGRLYVIGRANVSGTVWVLRSVGDDKTMAHRTLADAKRAAAIDAACHSLKDTMESPEFVAALTTDPTKETA